MPNELEIISPADTAQLEAAKARRGEHARLVGLPHPAVCLDGRPLDATLWPNVLRHIEGHVDIFSFEGYFATTRLIDDDGAVLTVAVRGNWSAGWLKQQYADLIVDAVVACGREGASVKLVADASI